MQISWSRSAGGRRRWFSFCPQYLSEKKEAPELDPETESELDELQRDLENTLGRGVLQRALSRAKTATAISELDRERRRGPLVSTSRSMADGEDKEEREVAGHDTQDAPGLKVGQQLIDAEKSEIGGVKSDVYIYYARSIGFVASAIAALFYAAFQGFSVGANIWLSAWTADPLASTDVGVRNKYLAVYGVLGLLQGLAIMVATVLLSVFTLSAATKLHSTMLMRILRSPMSFFDTTPLGR